MGSDNRNYFVFLKEMFGKLASEEVRAASYVIMLDEVLAESCFIIDWISPHQIAK